MEVKTGRVSWSFLYAAMDTACMEGQKRKKDSAMQLVTALQNPLLFAEIVMKFEP